MAYATYISLYAKSGRRLLTVVLVPAPRQAAGPHRRIRSPPQTRPTAPPSPDRARLPRSRATRPLRRRIPRRARSHQSTTGQSPARGRMPFRPAPSPTPWATAAISSRALTRAPSTRSPAATKSPESTRSRASRARPTRPATPGAPPAQSPSRPTRSRGASRRRADRSPTRCRGRASSVTPMK